MSAWENDIKEGVWLRNSSAAPIRNHFAVVTPMSQIRELVTFLIWLFSVWGGVKGPFNNDTQNMKLNPAKGGFHMTAFFGAAMEPNRRYF